ncbi:hypothetical protein [Burkholderia ubonensis]|uniref:hypothetical protein n=1 Tax=Burkholderia ubonensis TaxID=101571 RepID=UPI0008FE6835|nr:hypothetical protein BGV50_15375 [Burkholderia ubonensis]
MPRILATRRIAGIAAVAGTMLMSSGTASADALHTASDIKGASLVPLGALPRSPEHGSLDPYCTRYRAEKTTAIGRQVAQLGWIVTSEAPLGRYRVVTFASGFEPGTSGICMPRNGNLAIFDGTSLIALAYTARKSDWQIGKATPLESGALLVWEGQGVGGPIGELHEENGGFRLTEVAPERTFCHGRAVVPNVYGKPLDVARKILISHGWKPRRPSEKPGELDAAAGLAKRGVIEAETCSGTGVGYCGFSYRGSAGVLGVTTVGGDPEPANNNVVDYDVSCSAK